MGDVVRSKKGVRILADPFVVAPPSGTSTRTSLQPTAAEEMVLRHVGDFLGSKYRTDLALRVRIGKVPKVLNQRTVRKQKLTAETSSRWAGAITRAVEDQYQLSMRALTAETSFLEEACGKILQRLAVPVGERNHLKHAGYRSTSEQFHKIRRLEGLERRLTVARTRLTEGHPVIVVGGRKRLTRRHNLADAGPDGTGQTVQRWQQEWRASRMFITADGEKGAPYGNYTIHVETDGTVALRIPHALVGQYGPTLRLAVPATFTLRGAEWADRRDHNQALRYDISYDVDKARWYLNSSWGYPDLAAVSPLAALQSGSVLGVDLNADHLSVMTVDTSGNPVGTPVDIQLAVQGAPASTRDGHLRQGISQLLAMAVSAGVSAIAIENLNFADARHTGRETMGRAGRGKKFRRTVAGIPTAKFRNRLTAMAATRGIHIIAVDPAYTSKWGAQHWRKPLQTHTSDPTVTGHMAAAVAIGRRAHGHPVRRRKDGLRTQQRTCADLPLTDPTATPVPVRAVTGSARQRPPKSPG